MGIYTRDYYRHGSFGDSIPPVCKNLIIANVIVFLLQIFITRPATMDDMQATIDRFKQMVQRQTPHLEKRSQKNKDSSAAAKPKASSTSSSTSSESGDKTTHEAENNEPEEDLRSDENLAMANFLPRISIVEEWFQLEASKVVRYGQIWRLITCAFCHDRTSPWHIIFNMLALYWFGGRLEQFYGSKEFLLFYLTAAVVSSLCYIGLDLFTGNEMPAIGASGAVMAAVVLYSIHWPYERFYIYFFFSIEIRWLVLLYVILDLHPVLLELAGTPQYTGIANAAHLGGAAFGFLYWRYRLRLEDYWDRVVNFRRTVRTRLQRNVRLYSPPGESTTANLDSLIDKILEKIHKEGDDSLTDVERDILRMGTEKLKRRPKA